MLLDELTEQQASRIYEPHEDWSDKFALEITKKDFEQAEIYRSNNHDQRWIAADNLYLGYERQRFWEGSKVPRSSIGMFVVLSQIESLLPKVLSTIFSDNPWFEVGPQPGTTLNEALAVRDFMLYQFEQARRMKNSSVREVFRRAIKSAFLYGNGIVEIGWLDILEKKKKLVREMAPVSRTIQDPQYGDVPIPTGRQEMRLTERLVEKRLQTPFMRNVSIKDFYIDPLCPAPQVQAARFAHTRALMTVDEVWALRNTDGYNVPEKSALLEMAKNRARTQGEQSKAATEMARNNTWNPYVDTTADPAGQRLEVITRWSNDRCVWMLNREHVLYNAHNHYGFIPLFNAFYTDVLDRFHGLAVTDVVEGEHRVQGGIINARMDELSLKIHGGMVKRRGATISTSQLRRKPGRVIEAENPKEDIVFEEQQEVTPQAFLEINASDLRVQKSTGITDLVMAGTPSAGGNSANRTAAGVNAQVSAAGSRFNYIVENSEDTFVEPILTAWHAVNSTFMDPDQLQRIFINGQEKDIDPLTILNAELLFYMRASSKMQSRAALAQNFQFISGTLLNPAFIQMLQQQGKTVDFSEFSTLITDMTGYRMRGQFIRPMTPEEIQRAQQPKPEENVKLQMQRERMQDLKELQGDQNMADLQKTLVEKGLDVKLEEEKEKNEPKGEK